MGDDAVTDLDPAPPADTEPGTTGESGDEPPPRRTARWVALGVGVVLVGLMAVFAVGPRDRLDPASAVLGQRVPEVQGATMDGGTYNIDDHRGEWVLVNFFATWCPPCKAEHPELKAFEDWGRATGRASVVAVVFNDTPEAVGSFFETNGGGWPVLYAPSIPVAFQVAQIPESFLVSPSGQVVQHVQGQVTAESLITLIEDAEQQGASQ
ncbi:MAG: TlpA family protein disulfide reductase [Acidimicrobiales bacterium]